MHIFCSFLHLLFLICTLKVHTNSIFFSWTPSEDYFNTILLGVTPGCLDPNNSTTCNWFNDNINTTTMNINKWSNFGEMHWELVMCLLAAWIIVGLALSKGVQSSGKVVYFTAIFPFVVLFIFFVYGLTLDGMEDGISLYLKPDIAKLKDIKVVPCIIFI